MNTPAFPDAHELGPDLPSGQIITFYSYKGGVGRTMALANVAALLTQRGKSVLAIDFDLEAPGLHRYFLENNGSGSAERYIAPTDPAGVIELFASLRDAIIARFATLDEYDADPTATRTALVELVRAQLDDPRYRIQVRLNDPNQNPSRPAETLLSFMKAGQLDDSYARRVHEFDWQSLYRNYAEIFEFLADELRARYDYILIDSRTGISDMGSICTVLLPDKLVLCFTTNQQSLQGALDVGKQAVLQRKAMAGARPLGLFPLPGRLENAEQDLQRTFLAEAQARFVELLKQVDPGEHDLSTYFSIIRVPHISYYAYGEKIDAERSTIETSGTLAKIYAQLLEWLTFFRSVECVQLSENGKMLLFNEKILETQKLFELLISNSPEDRMQKVLSVFNGSQVPELSSLFTVSLAFAAAARGEEQIAYKMLNHLSQKSVLLTDEQSKSYRRVTFIQIYLSASLAERKRLRKFWNSNHFGTFPSEAEVAEVAANTDSAK